MNPTYNDQPGHLRCPLDTCERLNRARLCARILQGSALRIDALAVSGVSGITFGTSMADTMGLPLVIIRKKDENCHSWDRYTAGPDATGEMMHWVFVDDLIASGATFSHVCTTMASKYGSLQRCVAVMLYQQDMGRTAYLPDLPIFTPEGRKQIADEREASQKRIAVIEKQQKQQEDLLKALNQPAVLTAEDIFGKEFVASVTA